MKALTVNFAKELIEEGKLLIGLTVALIEKGHDVKSNYAKLAKYRSDVEMLENWLKEQGEENGKC